MAERDAGQGPYILGLTGPIACGKTTVGDLLLELGAIERIDADRVVHGLMTAGTPVTREIAEAFGTGVLATDGSVDRARLGEIVFANPTALRRLEAIVHPGVRREIQRMLAGLRGRQGVVVLDAVRLLQSELLPLCQSVWVVRCDPAEQRRRLTENRGMTESQAESRRAAQPSFESSAVTYVIDNSGSLEDLCRQVEGGWRELSFYRTSHR